MNRATRAAIINFEANPFQLRASFFHSTPVLERKRRTHWDSGGGGAYRGSSNPKRFNFSRTYRKRNAKQELLRNVSAFAENLFQSWQHDRDEHDESANRSSSWFRHDLKGNGPRGAKSRNSGPHRNRRGFQFFEDDDEIEVETIFSSAFGGTRYYYYSFLNEEPQQRNSSGHFNNHRFYWNQKHKFEEDFDSSDECDTSQSDTRSYRLALGLSPLGPLNLEDVKSAYRMCALKWHPDRHQGSSKVVAEEKFKACSAAYQSLCDKLVLN